jgi:hypothetical protein
MGLKRRVEKSYSIEEMMNIINNDFIIKGISDHGDESQRIYVISSTCFQKDSKRFVMCDSRDNDTANEEGWEGTNLLKPYYGATIMEVITKCFVDIANHG